jgi:hypothetical protein
VHPQPIKPQRSEVKDCSNATSSNEKANIPANQHSRITQPHNSSMSSNPSNGNDEMLNAIPNLVNNLLKNGDHQLSKYTLDQKILVNQLLTAIIVEFAEPHFVRTSNLEKASRVHKEKSKIESPEKKSSNSSSVSSIEFSERAVAWATSCLSTLLQTTLSTEETTHHIPELDGLLAATGDNNQIELEEMMQQSLLCGFMAARSNSLRSNNVFDFVKVAKNTSGDDKS